MNRIDLDGRVAVITGGSGGIGMATAERMLASGARVALWDRDPASLDAARGRFPGFVVDVTDEASVAQADAATFAQFGRVDILVNAAGVTAPKVTILETALDSWRRIVEINLTGTFLVSRAVGRRMVAANYGRIVNLGSVSGKEGNPFSAAYSASKAGVHSLTKSLAKELAHTGVRVNCVTPAIIATRNLYHDQPEEMRKLWVSRVPMGRPGLPEEVAAMITWLASEECSFTTGAAFDLSGGRSTY
jgi:NAD(P)-dependent dehydrogenase (short-subunit alcohol dehydrogenase family)